MSVWQAEVDRITASVPRPTVTLNPRVEQEVRAYWSAVPGQAVSEAREVLLRHRATVETTAVTLAGGLADLEAALAEADAEAASLSGRIGGRTAAWLPLLAVDRRGLTVNGDRCGFFPVGGRPVLQDSALGRVGLYARGPQGQVSFAHFDTLTSRPATVLPCEGGAGLGLAVRSSRLLAGAGSHLAVAVEDEGTGCRVRISLQESGIALDEEVWHCPTRDPATVAATINGETEDAGRSLGSRLVGAVVGPDSSGTVSSWSVTLPVRPTTVSADGGVEPGHVLSHWESSRPGAALDVAIGGPATLVEDLDPARLRRVKDLSVEAWVRGVAGTAVGTVLSQAGSGTGYTVDLVPALCGARLEGGGGIHLAGRTSSDAGTTGFTVEAWVVPPTTEDVTVLEAAEGGVGLGWSEGAPWFGPMDDSGSPARPATPPECLVDDAGEPAWRHLAGVWDGAAYWLLLDGRPVAVRRATAPADVRAPTAWTLGDSSRSAQLVVDEVRIWERARSGSEVIRQMRSRVPGESPGLVCALRFRLGPDGVASPRVEPPSGAGPVGVQQSQAVPAALPAYALSARVGDTQARSTRIFDAGSWHHVAAVYAERSAVSLALPSARLESADQILDLTGDLTLELDLVLDEDSPPGVLLGRGSLSNPEVGMPYELSLTEDGRLRFTWLGDDGVVRSCQSEGRVPRAGSTGGAVTRVGVSRREVPGQTTLNDKEQPVTAPGYKVVRFLVGSDRPEPEIKVNGQATARSGGGATRIGHGVQVTVTEVRIWSVARAGDAWTRSVGSGAKGLVAWWTLAEAEGGGSTDRTAALQLRLRGGARWVPSPDPDGSTLSLYLDGTRTEVETGPSDRWPDPSPWAMTGFAVGSRPDGARALPGQLEEVRVWRTVRTAEQIQDNLYRRLVGEGSDLVGRWTFAPRSGEPYRDQSPRGHDLTATHTRTDVSTAPLSGESPLLHDAMLDIGTALSTTTTATPAVAEYADLQRSAVGEVTGVFKRCYGLIRSGRLHLVTGFKIGDLRTEWVGQVQTDPQLKGYIEGAPPVPGENLTVEDDYTGRSTVALTRADDTTYSYASSEEAGRTTSSEGKYKVGYKEEVAAGILIEKQAVELEAQAGVATTYEDKHGWLEESVDTQGSSVGSVTELTLTRFVDRSRHDAGSMDADGSAPQPGEGRFRPHNTGMALVESETMDIFALRLAGSGALVSYSMMPNPDIPRDRNLIMFDIDPRYTKQGTLDGRLGNVTDDDYPQATAGPGHSYFKPVEAYRLRTRIQEDASRATARWDQRRARGYVSSGVEPRVSDLARRNLVNTYVWTADGGMFAEEEQSMASLSTTTGGTYSWASASGLTANLSLFAGPGFSMEVTALTGGYRECRETRAVDASSSFGVSVSLDLERDLRDTSGAPTARLAPGKVDAYRFMTFYLEPASGHYDSFFSQVVDPVWLQGSSPGASALRGARQQTRRPACWRILHRVTFVSRVLAATGAAAHTMDAALQREDLSSSHELVRTLDPLVRHARGSSGSFEAAVGSALRRHLPELLPYTARVVETMRGFYGDVGSTGNEPAGQLSVWTGPDLTATAGQPVLLAGRVLDPASDRSGAQATWSTLSGPQPAEFDDPAASETQVVLPQPGRYLLRLAASSGTWQTAWDDVTVTAH